MFSLHYSAVTCIKKAYTHSLNTALMDLLHKSDGKHDFAANVDRKASIKQPLSFYSSLPEFFQSFLQGLDSNISTLFFTFVSLIYIACIVKNYHILTTLPSFALIS